MQTEIINLGLGFIEGVALIVSPCILPILPIILAGSLTGSKKRPLGIIVGFVVIFSLFTLFSRQLVAYSGLDLNIVRDLSYGLLLLLGLVMLSSHLTEKFTRLTQRLANVGSHFTFVNNPQSGFIGGIFFGGLVALIWTPCAGPILAAVIVQTVLQKTNLMSFFTVLAFALGAAGPMLLIVLFGRQLLSKLGFLKARAALFRRALGVIIIASVAYMVFSEGSLASVVTAEPTNQSRGGLEKGLASPYLAPPLAGIVSWINSPPLQLNDLRGKVVLIDFWTYSCINCVRTLPYIKDWYQKYHKLGLVIIGIHTPEFDFEKKPANVQEAVTKDGLLYPVALDNNFATWQNYENRYWPAHYLIDKKGYVVYTHSGEGDYDSTENNIRFLLGLQKTTESSTAAVEASFLTTPETYLGYARSAHFSSPEALVKNQAIVYSLPKTLKINDWALQGTWNILPDRILALSKKASIKLHFRAQKVYAVMGSKNGETIQVKLQLNGKPLVHEGEKVSNSSLAIKDTTLYEILALPQFAEGDLELSSESPGLEIYTFTFGG